MRQCRKHTINVEKFMNKINPKDYLEYDTHPLKEHHVWNDKIEFKKTKRIQISGLNFSGLHLYYLTSAMSCLQARYFCRALTKLLVIARNSDWFNVLVVPVVIGRRNNFAIGFSTVIWKPLFSNHYVVRDDLPSTRATKPIGKWDAKSVRNHGAA